MLHSSEKVRRGSVAGMEHVRVTRRALLRGGPAHAPPLSPSARIPGQTFTNRAPLASPESVPSVLVTLPLVCPWAMFIG